tara:strand:- start:114 stop:1052 length:939 start_codon:yes stop_codon:yes gene_type:complete
MKKIFITGGAGYVGSYLVPMLLKKNYNVTVFDTLWFGKNLNNHKNLKIIKGDIRDLKKLNLKGFDTVLHLAYISNDPCCDMTPRLNWEVGPLSSMKLIEKSIEHKVKNFIFSSSGSVYGVKKEKKVVENLKLEPISDYNKSKMVTERTLLSYGDKINLAIVRPATVCGFAKRLRLDLAVNILTFQAYSKKEMSVFGGKQKRPVIHIDDICRLYLFLIEKKIKGIFNANNGNYSIKNIAEQIQLKTGAKIKFLKSNDPRSYNLSSEKIIKKGFKFNKKLDFMIDELLENFKSNNITDNIKYNNLKVMQKKKVK